MKIAATFGEVRESVSGRVGLIPTMGFLHEGHLALVDEARRRCDTVVMSVFVNPLQFDRTSDLDRYPRDLERDIALAGGAGVDVVFAPADEAMFAESPLTTVAVGEIGDTMEGEFRPGHFHGVATVVAKLLAGSRPDLAFFGRKDHQQLAIVRQMAADLSFPVDVVGLATVREPDGLALSSRNTFLSDRLRASSISRGLMAAADAVEEGVRSGSMLEGVVAKHLELDSCDYVALASQDRCRLIKTLDRPAFLAVAGWVGDVRLIDNVAFDLVGESFFADRGMTLDEPSELARS
ncbi:pantoate--beta-alanine ligase [soil metagenome]